MKSRMDIFVFKKENIRKCIIFILSCLITFLILASAISPEKYDLEVNQISDVSIKAPYDIEDKITTDALKKSAAEKVEESNTFNEDAFKDSKAEVDKLYSLVIKVNRDVELSNDEIDELREMNKEDKEDNEVKDFEEKLKNKKLETFKNLSELKMSDEDITNLLELSAKDANDLKVFIEESLYKLYERANINEVKSLVTGEVAIKPEDEVNAQQILESFFNNSLFPGDMKELGKTISFKVIKPNLIYDGEAVKKKREEARNSVKAVIIRKGQHIVQDGEVVSKAQMAILKELGVLGGNGAKNGIAYISSVLIAVIVIALQWMFIYRFEKKVFDNDKTLTLICVINVLFLGLCRGIQIISPFIIPMTLAPILLSLLVKNNIAVGVSVLNSVLVILTTGADISMSSIIVMSSVLGVVLLRKMEQRNDILLTSFFIGLINVALLGGIQFTIGANEYMTILLNCLFVFLGAIFSGILSLGLLPFLESIFDVVTNVKLLELSNPNHPLLKKLLMDASGTYHHSVIVGNLSEMAAQAVDANSVIARVGAFYHDIGKIKRPYFFKENQRGENPHDNITPNLSTLIITSHVKDGLELAKEHNLPMAIKDIITQHHGSSLVKYFYITMKNNSENPDDVKEEDFMYPGPKPKSKEAAIVMLADGVEAAVRSLSNPTKEKIEGMVDNIIKARLNEGQLDECELTLKDLTKIKDAFLSGLGGIYHQRIEYPKLITTKEKEKEDFTEKVSEEIEARDDINEQGEIQGLSE